MPAHGVGTAYFLITVQDVSHVLKLHNCLLCHGEDGYNLSSVSQILRQSLNGVVFRSGLSNLEIQGDDNRDTINFALEEIDGLYEMKLLPLYPDDERMTTLMAVHGTLESDPKLWGQDSELPALPETKSPTKLEMA